MLRMSVGVHSGSYAMFLVGGSHREVLIGGRGATTVVAMESLASAGQILVSADTASALPRGVRCSGGACASSTCTRTVVESVRAIASFEGGARSRRTASIRVAPARGRAAFPTRARRPGTASTAFIQFRLNGHRHLSLDDLAQGEQHPLVVVPHRARSAGDG